MINKIISPIFDVGGVSVLLEVKVIGSYEWFEEVYPLFKSMGFSERSDLFWSDPETDGEYMGYYFEYDKDEPLSYEDFTEFIENIKQTIMEGEAPFIKINFVKKK